MAPSRHSSHNTLSALPSPRGRALWLDELPDNCLHDQAPIPAERINLQNFVSDSHRAIDRGRSSEFASSMRTFAQKKALFCMSNMGYNTRHVLPYDTPMRAVVLNVDRIENCLFVRPLFFGRNYGLLTDMCCQVDPESLRHCDVQAINIGRVFLVFRRQTNTFARAVCGRMFYNWKKVTRYQMYLIDEGCTEFVELRDIFLLPHTFSAQPPLCIPLVLTACGSISPHSSCDHFPSLYFGEQCVFTISSLCQGRLFESTRESGYLECVSAMYPPAFMARVFSANAVANEFICSMTAVTPPDRGPGLVNVSSYCPETFSFPQLSKGYTFPAQAPVVVVGKDSDDSYWLQDMSISFRIQKHIVKPCNPLWPHIEEGRTFACIVELSRARTQAVYEGKSFYRALASDFCRQDSQCSVFLVDFAEIMSCDVYSLFDLSNQPPVVLETPGAAFKCDVRRRTSDGQISLQKAKLAQNGRYFVELLSVDLFGIFHATINLPDLQTPLLLESSFELDEQTLDEKSEAEILNPAEEKLDHLGRTQAVFPGELDLLNTETRLQLKDLRWKNDSTNPECDIKYTLLQLQRRSIENAACLARLEAKMDAMFLTLSRKMDEVLSCQTHQQRLEVSEQLGSTGSAVNVSDSIIRRLFDRAWMTTDNWDHQSTSFHYSENVTRAEQSCGMSGSYGNNGTVPQKNQTCILSLARRARSPESLMRQTNKFVPSSPVVQSHLHSLQSECPSEARKRIASPPTDAVTVADDSHSQRSLSVPLDTSLCSWLKNSNSQSDASSQSSSGGESEIKSDENSYSALPFFTGNSELMNERDVRLIHRRTESSVANRCRINREKGTVSSGTAKGNSIAETPPSVPSCWICGKVGHLTRYCVSSPPVFDAKSSSIQQRNDATEIATPEKSCDFFEKKSSLKKKKEILYTSDESSDDEACSSDSSSVSVEEKPTVSYGLHKRGKRIRSKAGLLEERILKISLDDPINCDDVDVKYQAYFEHIRIPEGSELSVKRSDEDFSWTLWPLFFVHIQSPNNRKLLETCLDALQATVPLRSSQVRIGMACIAHSEEYDAKYRAVVTGIRIRSVEVFYVDYGNYEWVLRSALWSLEDQAYMTRTYPGMAVPCILSAFDVPGEKTQEEKKQLDELKASVACHSGIFRLRFVAQRMDGVYVVEVIDKSALAR